MFIFFIRYELNFLTKKILIIKSRKAPSKPSPSTIALPARPLPFGSVKLPYNTPRENPKMKANITNEIFDNFISDLLGSYIQAFIILRVVRFPKFYFVPFNIQYVNKLSIFISFNFINDSYALFF